MILLAAPILRQSAPVAPRAGQTHAHTESIPKPDTFQTTEQGA